MYWRDFLPKPTGPAVYIWHNILVFHFASNSIYNFLFYGFRLDSVADPVIKHTLNLHTGSKYQVGTVPYRTVTVPYTFLEAKS